MKCKEIREQGNINLKLQNKKKQKLKEKGITLIALVVTIIILLILAGVTLNMAMNGDGLFSRARNAADKYKKAQEDEQELISEIGKEMNSEYVGAYVTGYEPTEGMLEITAEQSGTDESQTFTTVKETENGKKLEWRIWDYDGTTLRIILDKPTTQTLKLNGKAGYNNGVWVINEICRQCFGNDEMNGIDVANLRRSDIENVSTYDYTKYVNNLIHYGEGKNYGEGHEFPELWISHDSMWNYRYNGDTKPSSGDPSCKNPWEQEYMNEKETESGNMISDKEIVRSSLYVHEYKKNDFKNEKYYDMIYSGVLSGYRDGYYLATRWCTNDEDKACFGICVFGNERYLTAIGGYTTCSSSDGDWWEVFGVGLRPIVSINLKSSGYNLIRIEKSGGVEYELKK